MSSQTISNNPAVLLYGLKKQPVSNSLPPHRGRLSAKWWRTAKVAELAENPLVQRVISVFDKAGIHWRVGGKDDGGKGSRCTHTSRAPEVSSLLDFLVQWGDLYQSLESILVCLFITSLLTNMITYDSSHHSLPFQPNTTAIPFSAPKTNGASTNGPNAELVSRVSSALNAGWERDCVLHRVPTGPGQIGRQHLRGAHNPDERPEVFDVKLD